MNYFEESEFKCKCGKCDKGYEDVSRVLLNKLNRARHIANTPFTLTSAMRCPAHNRAEGGSPTSSHMNGKAVDIKVRSAKQRHTILTALIEAGFNRIGIADSFIHVDVDNEKRNGVCWVY